VTGTPSKYTLNMPGQPIFPTQQTILLTEGRDSRPKGVHFEPSLSTIVLTHSRQWRGLPRIRRIFPRESARYKSTRPKLRTVQCVSWNQWWFHHGGAHLSRRINQEPNNHTLGIILLLEIYKRSFDHTQLALVVEKKATLGYFK
jgi:hypothetical protein